MTGFETSLRQAPIVDRNGYRYVVHPITDGIPSIEPELLEEVAESMETLLPACDRIVTTEAMGIPIAAALSLRTGIPFTVIRKRCYGLPGEVSVEQVTGYSSSELFINGLREGDEVVFVDDVVSTGGTLTAVVAALQNMDVRVKKILVAVGKGDLPAIEKKVGMPIHTLVDIAVDDDVEIKAGH